MAATLTVTGYTGPGQTLTAKVFTNVLAFHVDTPTSMLSFTQSGSQQTTYVDITAATTVTATKSGTTWTLTIS
jgi:hypothetical protein